MHRPSWDEYFKGMATMTSTRSTCNRLHVGCVFVKNNRVISQGYNGFLPGCDHTSVMKNGHEMGTIHAEQNAVTDCAKRGVSCDDAIAYVTHYPCIYCMKILCAAGIKNIKYINDYHNDDLVSYFATQSKVTITKI